MPLIVHVEAVLACGEGGWIARIRSGGVADAVFTRLWSRKIRAIARFEPGQRRIVVVAVELRQEKVLEPERFVVCPQNDGVIATGQCEVVCEFVDLLIQRVRAGEALRPGAEIR